MYILCAYCVAFGELNDDDAAAAAADDDDDGISTHLFDAWLQWTVQRSCFNVLRYERYLHFAR